MKTSEQGLREWALDQITFDIGGGRIKVFDREQVQRIQESIAAKGKVWGDVMEVMADILDAKQVDESVLGVPRERIRDLQRAVKAGRMRLSVIDLVRYGGLKNACDAIPAEKMA